MSILSQYRRGTTVDQLRRTGTDISPSTATFFFWLIPQQFIYGNEVSTNLLLEVR